MEQLPVHNLSRFSYCCPATRPQFDITLIADRLGVCPSGWGYFRERELHHEQETLPSPSKGD